MVGSTIVLRSSSKRIVPVVKRTLFWSFLFDLNLGKPTFLPFRLPCLELDQLESAYNWALAKVKSDMETKKDDSSYLPTPWTLEALRKQWNQEKNEVVDSEVVERFFAELEFASDRSWDAFSLGTIALLIPPG